MERSALKPVAPDVVGDGVALGVEPRRRLPSAPHQATAAELAAAAANYRFTVGHDEAFPMPPSPLTRPKNLSSSGKRRV